MVTWNKSQTGKFLNFEGLFPFTLYNAALLFFTCVISKWNNSHMPVIGPGIEGRKFGM
jgi:hypothetical protein